MLGVVWDKVRERRPHTFHCVNLLVSIKLTLSLTGTPTIFSSVTGRPSMNGVRSVRNWEASCSFNANSSEP